MKKILCLIFGFLLVANGFFAIAGGLAGWLPQHVMIFQGIWGLVGVWLIKIGLTKSAS